VTADGLVVDNPRHLRQAERALKRADRRVSRRKQGSKRREKVVHLRAKQHRKVQRQRRDGHHTAALVLVRADDTIYLEDVRVRNPVRNRRLAKSSRMPAGRRSAPSSKAKQRMLANESSPCHPRTPARSVRAAGRACPRRCACARLSARPVGWCWTATRTRR
jgi:hypothetical protein